MKRKTLILVLILSAIFLSVGCGSSQEKNNPEQMESNTMQSESVSEKSMLEDTPVPKSKGTQTDMSTDVSYASSTESTSEPVLLSIDEFISKVSISIADAINPQEESIDDISLENGNLVIYVTLGDPSPLSYEDMMLSRTSSITDHILSLEDCFDLWETITVDFGDHGFIQNGHDNIQDDGYGAYFRPENFIISPEK